MKEVDCLKRQPGLLREEASRDVSEGVNFHDPCDTTIVWLARSILHGLVTRPVYIDGKEITHDLAMKISKIEQAAVKARISKRVEEDTRRANEPSPECPKCGKVFDYKKPHYFGRILWKERVSMMVWLCTGDTSYTKMSEPRLKDLRSGNERAKMRMKQVAKERQRKREKEERARERVRLKALSRPLPPAAPEPVMPRVKFIFTGKRPRSEGSESDESEDEDSEEHNGEVNDCLIGLLEDHEGLQKEGADGRLAESSPGIRLGYVGDGPTDFPDSEVGDDEVSDDYSSGSE